MSELDLWRRTQRQIADINDRLHHLERLGPLDGANGVFAGWRFKTPLSADFAWINQGTATVAAKRSGQYMTVPAGAGGWRILKQAVPAKPYTIVISIAPNLPPASNIGCGFIWRQSSNGYLIHVGLRRNASLSAFRILESKWTSVTAFSASYYDAAPPARDPAYFLLSEDNTNRTADYCVDGEDPVRIYQGSRTDFLTANEVGWGVVNDDGSYTIGATLMSWSIT